MKDHSEKISDREALLRLQKICSHTEKSEAEIRQKIAQWGLQDKANTLITNLRRNDFINPDRYIRAFIKDKIQLNKWGKTKVRYYLRGQQFEDEIINGMLSEYDDETYENMVFSELRKKKKSVRENNPMKLKSKLYSFGNQRGYESHIISKFLHEKDS